MPELVRAIASVAKVNSEEIQRDMVCPNVAQNNIVLSTPEQARVSHYVSVRAVRMGGQAYEVFAYAAAPENTVKGVIRGIHLSETPELIRANVVNDYNDTGLEVHRIGSSHVVILLFNSHNVPAYVKFCGSLIRCSINRHTRKCVKHTATSGTAGTCAPGQTQRYA
ncbi:hypothetical protein MRX96_033486 [Rhipicephalus microplus]